VGDQNPSPTDIQWVALQNVDFSQNDMGSRTPLTIQDCANLCEQTDPCIAAVYSPSRNQCWLKKSLGRASVVPDRIVLLPSGATAPGADFGDNEITAKSSSSVEDCRGLCANVDSCVAAVYYAILGAYSENQVSRFALDERNRLRYGGNLDLCVSSASITPGKSLYLGKCSSNNALRWGREGNQFRPVALTRLCMDK
ncbi:hypothetical protein HDU99_003107, partial [Rhizoclosmatium hyalinum]